MHKKERKEKKRKKKKKKKKRNRFINSKADECTEPVVGVFKGGTKKGYVGVLCKVPPTLRPGPLEIGQVTAPFFVPEIKRPYMAWGPPVGA